MEYFLQRIAKSLYKEHTDNLSDHCLVFPSRRSGLFFLKYLAAEIKKPVWTPAVMTVNDLFCSLSGLHKAENEILLFELYKVYCRIKRSRESFDDFYFWGDMLLNDFDDVDKYLADASKLFQNVSDLKKIDLQFGGLSEEQISIVQQFWTNFDPDRSTDAKEKFISIWSILESLYNEFKKALTEKNLAYEGMIYREVAGNPDFLNSSRLKWDMVHFIGFNALNECEKTLMLKLREAGRAKFYWDFDRSYINERGLNSAGYFLRNNLKTFGNDMPEDWSYDTLITANPSDVKRRVIETSSDIAQVKLIPHLLEEIPGLTPGNAHNTAVVLADEALLLPVLSSLPESIPDINITMGYPLKQTSAYSLVKNLLDLQRNSRVRDNETLFSHQDVERVLRNELISEMMDDSDKEIPGDIIRKNLVLVPQARFSQSEKLSSIFINVSSASQLSDYIKNVLSLVVSGYSAGTVADDMIKSLRNEFIYRIILSINRLETITKSGDIALTIDTWTKLLERILRMQSVPFSGEPLSGIQFMGILETRTLDFKNLVMLSVNEGILPAVTTTSSFIPFSLREAFGLPSLNHQESVYAYHFYRLLHRAENVTFLFNSNPEGLRSGEMSRFLQQMKYEPSSVPEFQNLSFEIKNPAAIGTSLERTPDHNRQLEMRFRSGNKVRPLSPSAINTWMNCRMKFYYQYVNGLSEPKNVITEIDPAKLGSMLHAAIKSLYSGYIGRNVDYETVEELLRNRQSLEDLVRSSINEVLKREHETFAVINEMMVREVLLNYIRRILEVDRNAAPFTILSMEDSYSFRLTFETEGGTREVITGGNIDRVDIKDGITRIVDYKTGRVADSVGSLEELFEEDRDKELDAWLQTLIYCEAYLDRVPGASVRPSVYKLRKNPGEKYTDRFIIDGTVVEDFNQLREEFNMKLTTAVSAIMYGSEPFLMTMDRSLKCGYCPFRVLCSR